MKGLRAAVELMAQHVSQLVALGSRQIEALTNLPPALTRSAEGLSDGLRQVARAIQALPPMPPPVPDQATGAEPEQVPPRRRPAMPSRRRLQRRQ